MKPRKGDIETWTLFLRRCFHQRVGPEKFVAYAEVLDSKIAIPSQHLCEMLLPKQYNTHLALDPLLPIYVEKLLHLELLSAHHVLHALLSRRRSETLTLGDEAIQQVARDILTRSELEQSLLGSIVKVYTSSEGGEARSSIRQTLRSMSDWMLHLTRESMDMMIQSASTLVADVAQMIYGVRETFSAMLVTYLSRKTVIDTLKLEWMSETAKKAASALTSFIPVIAVSQMSLATRLDMIQKDTPGLQVTEASDTNKLDSGNESALVDPVTVSELQQVNTRASFYMYLDQVLSDPCTFNDNLVLSYMHTKYAGDTASAILGITLAAFDILASSPGDRQRSFVQHSFLITKVPSLISSFASMSFVPMQLSILISQALNQVDQSAFPIETHRFDPGSEGTQSWDPRTAFVAACSVTGLITERELDQILGERPTHHGSSLKRLDRHNLANECKRDGSKVEQLARHVGEIDANAAVRNEVLIECIHARIVTRDTSALGKLARQLSLDTKKLDNMALFSSALNFLQSLCHLLLDWQQGTGGRKPQNEYEDFGACLFLLLRMSNRYNLPLRDFDLPADDTLFGPLMEHRSEPMDVKTLPDDRSHHLTAWIKALFDNKTVGESVLASCPVNEFYGFVPTIYQQTVLACRANILDVKSLKVAMDLMLDTPLLPALVPGLRWLAANLQPESSDTSIVILMLTHLARAGAASGEEATAIHAAIMRVVGPEILAALDGLTRHGEIPQEIESLYYSIESQQSSGDGTTYMKNVDLKHWAAPQRGSMIASFRAAFKNLCYWSSHSAMGATRPVFTYAHLRSLAQCAGARPLLNALVEEVKTQVNGAMGEIALDIATTVIYSASKRDARGPRLNLETIEQPTDGALTLQEALNLALQDPSCLATTDTVKAETYIRLHRRSNSLSTAIAAAGETTMPMDMPTTEDIMHDINLDVGDAAANDTLDFGHNSAGELHLPELEAQLADQRGNQTTNVDVSDPFATLSGHNQFTNPDDDIFGGLVDLDDSTNLNF